MTKEEILDWLSTYNETNSQCTYTINDDMSIDVKGNVTLGDINGIIPAGINFNKIEGDFKCGFYSRGFKLILLSLRGCPKKVTGDFKCYGSTLQSLECCPEEVGGSFYCHYNNLESLKGCPKEVGGGFYCHSNKLKTLAYIPVCNDKILSDFTEKEVKIEQNIMKQAKTYEEGVQTYQDYLDIFGDD